MSAWLFAPLSSAWLSLCLWWTRWTDAYAVCGQPKRKEGRTEAHKCLMDGLADGGREGVPPKGRRKAAAAPKRSRREEGGGGQSDAAKAGKHLRARGGEKEVGIKRDQRMMD